MYDASTDRSSELIVDSVRYFLWVKTWVQAFPTLIHEILEGSRLIHDSLNLSPNSFYRYLGVEAFQSLLQNSHLSPVHTQRQDDDYDGLSMDQNLTYGEIEPNSMAFAILFIANFHQKNFGTSFLGEKIVDLGSGRGKALLMASLIHPFKKAWGIEIIPLLVDEALDLYRNTFERESLWLNRSFQETTEFIYLHEDLRFIDPNRLWDSSVIIVHATMFDTNLMECVQNLCLNTKGGCYFVMISQCLQSKAGSIDFQTVASFELHMSWGQTSVFIQRKV